MQPVQKFPIDQIIQGDCRQVLNEIPAESVDMVFADPPYNLQLHQELRRPDQSKVTAVEDSWDQFASFQAYDKFTREWLTACRRVLKPTGTLWVIGTYHNIYRVGAVLQDLDFWILNDLIWIKTNPMPNFRGVRFTNAQETLIWAQKVRGAGYTFNYQTMKALNGGLQMRSDWSIPLCTGTERLRVNGNRAHPTQKPEALLYRVVLAASNPGDVVLDPFFGTGTTGVVARRLGRKWIGIEVESDYVKLASERIGMIEVEPDLERSLKSIEKRRQARVPFGALLEQGLLNPGQILHFDQNPDFSACVMANGQIEYRDQKGSIHQVAREIVQGPCNGWQRWYYYDTDLQEWAEIDRLREKIRNNMEQNDEAESRD